MNAKDLRALYNLSEEDNSRKGSERDEVLFLDIMFRVKERAEAGERFLVISGLFWHEGIHLMNILRELGYGAYPSHNNQMYSILLRW